MFDSHLLSILTLAPAAAAVGLGCIPGRFPNVVRWLALAVSVMVFFVALLVWIAFNPELGQMQMVEKADWIPQFGIEYHLGIDGISLLLVMLTTFLIPIVIAASWTSISTRVKAFHLCLLLLSSGMIGAFLALDVFLFYTFWELMLIPMYFIIGVWGGARRIYAAVKFFLFTMAGSVLMLVAILYTARHHFETTGAWSFDYLAWLKTAPEMPLGGLCCPQNLVFLAFALAFAIKVPLFPFHTWLPDAHVEAPAGGSIILAGVLLKLGTYGFLRFNRGLFPEVWQWATPAIMVLAVVGILYGALVALAQPDVKRLVAYSSVSHLGFVMLGLAAGTIGSTQGAVLQMVNHGLATGALFLLVGILYERRGTRLISDFGGIASVAPVFTGIFLLVTLASIGLPGLNGFVGEFLILAGSWPVAPVAVVGAGLGIVLGAVYMLWMVQRVFWNPLIHEENRLIKDIGVREFLSLAPLVILIVWIGIHPMTFLTPIEASVRLLLK